MKLYGVMVAPGRQVWCHPHDRHFGCKPHREAYRKSWRKRARQAGKREIREVLDSS